MTMTKIPKWKKLLTIGKYQFKRGHNGYVAAVSLAFLVAQGMQNYIKLPIWILLPIGIGCVWLLGWLDTKFKLLDIENKFFHDRVPQITQINEKLDRIEKRLNETHR